MTAKKVVKKKVSAKPVVKYATSDEVMEALKKMHNDTYVDMIKLEEAIIREKRRTNNVVRVLMALPKRFLRRKCFYGYSDGGIDRMIIKEALINIDP